MWSETIMMFVFMFVHDYVLMETQRDSCCVKENEMLSGINELGG